LSCFTAILFRFLADYTAAKQAFLQTPEGQEAFEQLRLQAEETGQFVETLEFKQSVPGYVEAMADAKIRIMNLIKRLKPAGELSPMLAVVAEENEKMIALANKLLEVNQIEGAGLILSPSRFSLKEVTQKAVKDMESFARFSNGTSLDLLAQ